MPRREDIHVGQRIRQRRWILNLTQQQVAAQIGVQFQQLQKYETGMNRVSASRMPDSNRDVLHRAVVGVSGHVRLLL
ncbi:helix-turn-helix transcriptional regulator [Ruegeria sp. HKCCD8929]|uniref:helix-turn-helix domain-containing protein n=1 Tax=Ruegeria sp. HKCCD8929 TaxID=2683006 RepID=UPI0014885562